MDQMSLVLRPLTLQDFLTVDAVLTAAYAPATSMLSDLVWYHRLQPDGWIIAVQGGRAVGMGGALLYGPYARIGLMTVLPELQGQGIGTAILHSLLRWTANHGATTVLLDATPQGVPLYEKLGFVVNGSTWAYRHSGEHLPVDAPTGGVRRLEPDDLASVVRYDALRFGIERTRVITSYGEAFHDRTLVAYDKQGNITGYLIAQDRRLGPWLADNADMAEALLLQALHLPFSQTPMVLVPEANRAAPALLKRTGFLPERQWQSMHLGAVPDLHYREWLYGYANFYVG